MKKFWEFFKDFHKTYFDWKLYTACILFISALIIFNYSLDFEDTYIDHFRGKLIRNFMFMGYHLLGYYGILLIIIIFRRGKLKLSREFWIKSLLGFLILGIDRGYINYAELMRGFFPPEVYWFYYKLAYNFISLFTILVPLLILKFIFDRKTGEGLYGLRLKGVDWKAYWILLFAMVPLVYIASFIPEFIDYYPVYKRAGGEAFSSFYHIPEYLSKIIFEFFYITNFLHTELFFRGFLIIGFTRLLGKDAILPMVATYAILHFGKPIGETISSVFGGYIIGILALYTRNIWGGVFIHGGIALLMEIFAFMQLK